jgi:hypothetical protein
MGLYHSVSFFYGFEIPATTELDLLDEVIGDGPDLLKDSVGHHFVGDFERLLLVTRFVPVAENDVVRLAADSLAAPEELAAWETALHDIAVRLGHADHPAPAWLLVHDYS